MSPSDPSREAGLLRGAAFSDALRARLTASGSRLPRPSGAPCGASRALTPSPWSRVRRPTPSLSRAENSPLVIGLGQGENLIASDIPAVLRDTRRVILLEDGDFASLDAVRVTVTDLDGNPVTRTPIEITWDDQAAEKGGYSHFMLKEIHEGPRTVRETLRGRLTQDGQVRLPDLWPAREGRPSARRIFLVGCGTAYHAGMVGKRLFEQVLRRPVEVAVASEFRYSDPLVDFETLVALISQSGETADTLAAMREARARGAATLAVVNVVGSTLAREADSVLLTQAGPEIGVASTKAYLAQLTALTLLALHLAREEGNIGAAAIALTEALPGLPDRIQECLRREADIAALATRSGAPHPLFLSGAGVRLRCGAGSRAEAQGDLLPSRGSLSGRGDETWPPRAGRGGRRGHRPLHAARDGRKDGRAT